MKTTRFLVAAIFACLTVTGMAFAQLAFTKVQEIGRAHV